MAEPPPLAFHSEFAIKKPGDIILKCEKTDVCFYFRLALLAELSSFFRDLPAPSSDSDISSGTAIIPIPTTTEEGLRIFLAAVRAVTSFQPKNVLDGRGQYMDWLHAALLADLYDTPIVSRILLDDLTKIDSDDHTLLFALTVAAGLTNCIEVRMTRIIGSTVFRMPRFIKAFLQEHNPAAWCPLVKRQMSFTSALVRFQDGLCKCIILRGELYEVNHGSLKGLVDGLRVCTDQYELEERMGDINRCRVMVGHRGCDAPGGCAILRDLDHLISRYQTDLHDEW